MSSWLEQIDPGGHRRIKGLRLVTAYGLAAMLGIVLHRSYEFSGGQSLSYLAAGFALWASVSEGQTTRWLSARDLTLLNAAAVVGALMFVGLSSIPIRLGLAGPEWILITGAFLVGYLKRFGILGAGVGSQIYIGQLLAYGANITRQDLPMVLLAGLIAGVASIVPIVPRGPAEHPMPSTVYSPVPNGRVSREMRMALQSAVAALVIVLLRQRHPPATVGLGRHCEHLRYCWVHLWNCGSRSSAYCRNLDRCAPRNPLSADLLAPATVSLAARGCGNDHLRCHIARPL